MRTGPGTGYSLVNRLLPGRRVEILQGPVCEDHQLWYYVRSEEFTNSAGEILRIEGWTVEESGDTWLLEPLN